LQQSRKKFWTENGMTEGQNRKKEIDRQKILLKREVEQRKMVLIIVDNLATRLNWTQQS
jgi:hypothetical protein